MWKNLDAYLFKDLNAKIEVKYVAGTVENLMGWL